MTAGRIFITRRIPDAGIELLRSTGADITIGQENDERGIATDALLAGILAADVLLALLTERIDLAILSANPRLRGIANYAVGVDNIDVDAATRLGIPVSNTPGVLTEATADLTFALVLAAARRVCEAHAYTLDGRYRIWGPRLLLGADIGPGPDGRRKTFGIIGFGRIGKEMARRGTGFGMRLLAHDEYEDNAAAKEIGVTFTSLEELLQQSDFVSLHCTLTPETHCLIGAEQLAMMKPSAILINAARGPVVDTDALVDALRNGTIWAAGLDVTDPEPLPQDHPLVSLSNCIVVPHIASGTIATRNEMARLAVENCLAVLNGITPPHCVNPEVLE